LGVELRIIIKKTINPVLKVIDNVFESLRGDEIKGFFNIHELILAALKQLANTRGPRKVNHMTLDAYLIIGKKKGSHKGAFIM
jgi:hypothetical protein